MANGVFKPLMLVNMLLTILGIGISRVNNATPINTDINTGFMTASDTNMFQFWIFRATLMFIFSIILVN